MLFIVANKIFMKKFTNNTVDYIPLNKFFKNGVALSNGVSSYRLHCIT